MSQKMGIGPDGKYHWYTVGPGTVSSFTHAGAGMHSAPAEIRAEARRLQQEEEERQRQERERQSGRRY